MAGDIEAYGLRMSVTPDALRASQRLAAHAASPAGQLSPSAGESNNSQQHSRILSSAQQPRARQPGPVIRAEGQEEPEILSDVGCQRCRTKLLWQK